MNQQGAPRGNKGPQGVAAILLISCLYLVSTSPLLLYYIHATLQFWDIVPELSQVDKHGFTTVANLMSNLNSVGNFFVYLVSVNSFSVFVKGCLARCMNANNSRNIFWLLNICYSVMFHKFLLINGCW